MTGNVIARHRTALTRSEESRPIRLALDDALITPDTQVFDYGCGRGDDVRFLVQRGIRCSGWDPVYAPNHERMPADVVNLGYVINVIEDLAERMSVLSDAWSLARKLLIVSAQIEGDAKESAGERFSDGIITRLKTFQKFYDQQELKSFLESVLGTDVVAAGLGIFYAFKDSSDRDDYVVRRYTRSISSPRIPISQIQYDRHRELLQPLADFFGSRGRIPFPDELSGYEEVVAAFGSIKNAFAIVRRVSGTTPWERVIRQRRDDLVVFLALTKFEKRLPIGKLPLPIQRDIKAFFGAYTYACRAADDLLFRTGRIEEVRHAIKTATIGKRMPSALYVHESAVGYLDPVLRILEGCARRFVGLVDFSSVIKIYTNEPTVSYLMYPRFFEDAHPELAGSIVVKLKTLAVTIRSFCHSTSSPILHRKELLISRNHEAYARFKNLTTEEDAAGLFTTGQPIGTTRCWEKQLKKLNLALVDHHLVSTTGATAAEQSHTS